MSASAQITDNGSALGGRLGSMSLTRQMSRQMSIYSLTLDEFQSALGEPAKNFGSMNMDELLKNIWTAEESQAMAALFSNNDPASTSSLLPRQPSIQRQNSVTLLPLPQALSKKTVEEVWKDIAGGGGGEPSSNGGATGGGGAGEFGEPNIQAMKPRQSTYGEMTLEDFLVKAGVMTADPVADVVPVVHPFSNNQHYGGGAAGGGAVVTTTGYGNVETAAPSRMMNMMLEQKQQQQNLQPILGAMTGLLPSGKKEPIELNDPVLGIGLGPSNFSAGASSSNGYLTTYNNNQAAKQQAEWMDSQYKSAQQQQQQQQQLMQLQAAAGYMNGAGTSNGLGIGGGMSGYGPSAIVTKEGSPGSPLSDAQGYGLSPNGNYGLDVPLRGRKRILDAPLEKIVERRQRRMIKNRESAARSRARKQAYTVELEAEVTQLKEENMRLRKMQVRVQEEENSKKKKQVLEVIAPMTRHLPKMLRRTVTGPW